ncbi:hypothetical protein BCR33DRAFT_724456 [Rhizoclosmatium globosum]|uniref:Uncharacterized protein n=1 Tax=Rhizoclosmatium globosum TaxID=329046 RepID=A0A1Y2B5M4_9FUNG|nr:hypothetical protein BCR33DRAFT_724456 [Rhizoclosmatium globosum]|eukprot:ORY30138.1 hypothetical protein BCR33DRAFT_724456 [Rhizoclosmatium globosum]
MKPGLACKPEAKSDGQFVPSVAAGFIARFVSPTILTWVSNDRFSFLPQTTPSNFF